MANKSKLKWLLILTPVLLLIAAYIAGVIAGVTQSLSIWSDAGGNPIALLFGSIIPGSEEPIRPSFDGIF